VCRIRDNFCVGLVYPEIRERWTEIFATDAPDLVVMLMATWENAGLRSLNTPIDPGPDEPGWIGAYRTTILDPWVAEAQAAGTRVVWVGMPAVRNTPTALQHRELNAVWRTLTEEHESMTFVDGAALLAGPDAGHVEVDTTVDPAERLFQPDGVHLCPDGAERIVDAVAVAVTEHFGGAVNDDWVNLDWRSDERSYEPGECPEPDVS